jgi:transposase
MEWRTMAVRDQRVEFVIRVDPKARNMSALCAQFGISRPTGYLWLRRYREQGVDGIEERSRRPWHSPGRTEAALEQRIVELSAAAPRVGSAQTASLAPAGRYPVAGDHRA